MANTPWFSTRFWAAVSAPVGLDVASAATQMIFRPSIPPSAFSCLKRASMACAAVPKLEEAGPVWSLRIPILIVVFVIPGALAVSFGCARPGRAGGEAPDHH